MATELETTARRAYELGRLRRGLLVAGWVVPVALASALLGGRPTFACELGAVLFAASTALVWRGGAPGKGVGVGIAAGALAAAAALAFRCGNPGCASSLTCALLCGGGGVCAGALVAAVALRGSSFRRSFALTAGAIACATGMLGCAVLGVAGAVGLAVGLALASSPALLWPQPRTS